MSDYVCIAPNVKLGKNVKLSQFINLYGCEIGDNTKIGAFVEIQKNASVGNNCKISSHTFVCEGVTIEDDVFIGHGVTFINDSYPRATRRRTIADRADWKVGTHPGETRRLDRFGIHHPRQPGDRRKRHCRGRQRGDQRCAGKHRGGWKSGPSAPPNFDRTNKRKA